MKKRLYLLVIALVAMSYIAKAQNWRIEDGKWVHDEFPDSKAQTEPNSENPLKFRINITECGENVKEFKRILDPRIHALNLKGSAPKDYSVLYEKIRILEAVGTPPPKGVKQISLQHACNVLQKKYGTTIEEVVNECTNVIEEVNPYL